MNIMYKLFNIYFTYLCSQVLCATDSGTNRKINVGWNNVFRTLLSGAGTISCALECIATIRKCAIPVASPAALLAASPAV